MNRAVVGGVVAAALCAGCGGGGKRAQPPTPKLPRALAQAWSSEANAVAAALAEGDTCGAKRQSQQLRASVIAAINAGKVPAQLLEPLTSAVNALPERIVCTPPTPATTPAPPSPPPHKPKGKPPEHEHDHGHGHGHGHGHDKGEGD